MKMETLLARGTRARFFHPGAMGVMLPGTVQKVHDDDTVTVKFDTPFPRSTKRVFRVSNEHLFGRC